MCTRIRAEGRGESVAVQGSESVNKKASGIGSASRTGPKTGTSPASLLFKDEDAGGGQAWKNGGTL